MTDKESTSLLHKTITSLQQFEQRQDSVTNQMFDLVVIANKFGLYDAADLLRKQLGDK